MPCRERIIRLLQADVKVLGEMKCTASASFVETSAEDIVPLLYRKKEKQSGFVFVEAGLQEHIP